MEKTNGKVLPEKKFSTGAISATIWKNNGASKGGTPVEYRTIKLDRRYKSKEGVWQSTEYLRLNDLPKAALVLQKSYEFLVLKGQGPSSVSSDMEQIEEELVM